MIIALAENIKKLRKERRMTQEQLAEALGVTVGAVHKWESRACMPEIRMLMEMADLFCVSVDVLLGYEMKGSSIEDIIERIREHLNVKNFESAITEAEKALIRYPNSFSIVHCCADIYERKGVETGDKAALERAIELSERLIPLLSQNDDPEISEVTIRSDIATSYIMLGQREKGFDILRKYNAGGINNSMLGLMYAQSNEHVKEAEEYLEKGFSDVMTNCIRCMSGYINYYVNTEDINSALDASVWFVGLLETLKVKKDSVCYSDKIMAPIEALAASFMMHMGRSEEAEAYLYSAYRRAAAFDAAPVYNTSGIRFIGSSDHKKTVSDDLGQTAVSAVEAVLQSDVHNEAVLKMWEQLKTEDIKNTGVNSDEE